MKIDQKFQAVFNPQNLAALGILLLSLLVFWWIPQQNGVNVFTPNGLQQAVQGAGWCGPLVYMSVLALSVVICQIPGVPLAMAAGAVWGPVIAGVYSLIGGFLGALMAYMLGYTLGRSTIKTLSGKAIYFSKHRGEIYIGSLIFITRLLPLCSFDLISYGAGMTGVSLPIYAAATFLGMIPSTFLLTYMGSALIMDWGVGLGFAGAFLMGLVGLPWAIQRYNLFGLKGMIRVE